MALFYIDGVEKGAMKFLAGPFRDEATARKYELGVFRLAVWLGHLSPEASYGVTSIAGGYCEPGILNGNTELE